jgi:hypothetical protein
LFTDIKEGEQGVVEIFGPKLDELTAGWRRLHIEELHNVYSSRSAIVMMTSEKLILAGPVTRMGRE